MDTIEAFASFALFGIRLDSATLAQATLAAWEGALSRAGMRVMLVDMWTLLAGQREFGMWEALSAADYVYPLADDAVLRRAAQRQHMTVMKPDLLLYDLLDAAARANRPVVLLAPSTELDSDVALVRRIWPQLQVQGIARGDDETFEPDAKLVARINQCAPALLIMGGYSPWQEEFVHTYRDEMEYGTALTMPTLHTAMAAIGQRVGMPVMGIGRMRRRAAISRAITSTLRPAAEASAETVGTWLAGARDGFSAALHTRQSPAALRRIAAIEAPPRRAIAVRVTQTRQLEESSSRWAATSPLARINPPRLPALPAPATSSPSNSTPSTSAASWPAPPATGPGSAEAVGLPTGTLPDRFELQAAPEPADDTPATYARSPFEPERDEATSWAASPAHDQDEPPGGPFGGPFGQPDVSRQRTVWLSPPEREPWSSSGAIISGTLSGPGSPEPGEDRLADIAALPTHPFGDGEYDTFVVEPAAAEHPDAEHPDAEHPDAEHPDAEHPDALIEETLASLAPAEWDATADAALDTTRRLADAASGEQAPPEPSNLDQLAATTLLRDRAVLDDDPEALRVLASIDDLPPTRRLNERTVAGLPDLRDLLTPPDAAPATTEGNGASEAADAHEATEATDAVAATGTAPAATPASHPLAQGNASAVVRPPLPRSATRLSRKYVVRRMPRHIGHQRGRPRR